MTKKKIITIFTKQNFEHDGTTFNLSKYDLSVYSKTGDILVSAKNPGKFPKLYYEYKHSDVICIYYQGAHHNNDSDVNNNLVGMFNRPFDISVYAHDIKLTSLTGSQGVRHKIGAIDPYYVYLDYDKDLALYVNATSYHLVKNVDNEIRFDF